MFYINILISAVLIASASWLSKKFPTLAGFIVALPITTMLVLPLSYVQTNNLENTTRFAKSIFIAIPISLFFFVPFLLAKKIQMSFWSLYSLGCISLFFGYWAHKTIMKFW